MAGIGRAECNGNGLIIHHGSFICAHDLLGTGINRDNAALFKSR